MDNRIVEALGIHVPLSMEMEIDITYVALRSSANGRYFRHPINGELVDYNQYPGDDELNWTMRKTDRVCGEIFSIW